MEIKNINFRDFVDEVPDVFDGIVLLGAGGDLQEWIDGVTKMLVEEGIIPSQEVWDGAYKLVTTGGRTDLALPFKPKAKIDYGRMAMWRIRFGDCSWISDYVVNYEDQHMGA